MCIRFTLFNKDLVLSLVPLIKILFYHSCLRFLNSFHMTPGAVTRGECDDVCSNLNNFLRASRGVCYSILIGWGGYAYYIPMCI